MSTGYVIPLDPAELATRFSSEDRYEDPRFDEEDELSDYDLDPEELEIRNVSSDALAECISGNSYEDRIAPLLDLIPKREADLINLYFIEKKRQADIAIIFGVTQAAISYRLERGIQRLKFLLEIPQVTEEEMRTDLSEVFPQKIDVDILVGMWLTTCQSEVASKLGLTQGRVRHRFFKAVKILEESAQNDQKYQPYQKIFSAISNKRFNIRREVILPQWQDRGGDECM